MNVPSKTTLVLFLDTKVRSPSTYHPVDIVLLHRLWEVAMAAGYGVKRRRD